MSYTIYPKIKFLYNCDTIQVYNGIFNDLASEQGSTEVLDTITYSIQKYGDVNYLTSTATAINPNGVWNNITVSSLEAWVIAPTTSVPANSQAYTITITYSDSSTDVLTYTTTTGQSWNTVLTNLISDISTDGTAILEGSNIIVTSNLLDITSVVITTSNSDINATQSVNPNTTFTNGVYEFTVNYTLDNAVTGTSTYYLPIYCSIKKCILRLVSRLLELQSCNKCNSECIDYIMEGVALLESLESIEINNVEDITKVENIISALEAICDNEDCQCND
jgi:hypothetical protein